METRRRVAFVAIVVVLACGARLAAAFHTPFIYRVDRFEADGNVLGALDGVPNVVDDFNAAPLSPLWYQAYGTVSEAGGYLQVTSPGVHFPAPPDPSSPSGSLLDLSIAASGQPTWVYDGAGDFVATAYWEGVVPTIGHHYHFSVYTFGGLGGLYAETFGLAILQNDDGVQMEQHLTEIDQWSGTFQNTQLLYHAIDPADVTGQLVFRIMFDDGTNEATTAFSLDGGTTWKSPFPPGLIFQGRTQAQFLLSADPPAGPAPTTTTTLASSTTTTTLPGDPCWAAGCRRSLEPARGKLTIRNKSQTLDALKWKWKKGAATSLSAFGMPSLSTSYTFCLGDAAGNPFYILNIPAGEVCPSGSTCWRTTGNGWIYTDSTGFRGGAYKIALKSGVDGKASAVVRLQGMHFDEPGLPLALPITARLSNSLGECWAETFDVANLVRNTSTNFIGRGGSPSGAFVD